MLAMCSCLAYERSRATPVRIVEIRVELYLYLCMIIYYGYQPTTATRVGHVGAGPLYGYMCLVAPRPSDMLLLSHLLHTTAIPRPSLRLFTQSPLLEAHIISPPEGQRHYLTSVMRAKEGSRVALFNGVDGEWEAEVISLNRKRCELAIRRQLRPQPPSTPAPTLLFAVLKGTS